ncbi:uncharacterized protein LOC132555348 [Ylistrum balloti]|uniref:uncharacterized protein LOC132555348 n=1 Tax=Ylistrum balloti TaxID=509963 RepID=UPI0029059078|nr:uncharacterized protein LOC132555348 [Ylistrum balloti]
MLFWVEIVLIAVGVDCFIPDLTGHTSKQVSWDSGYHPPQLPSLPRSMNHLSNCLICPYIEGAGVLCIHLTGECDVHENRCFKSLAEPKVFNGRQYSKIDYDGQACRAKRLALCREKRRRTQTEWKRVTFSDERKGGRRPRESYGERGEAWRPDLVQPRSAQTKKLQSRMDAIKSKSKDDLYRGICDIWTEIPLAYIRSLHTNIPKRILNFIRLKRHLTKYRSPVLLNYDPTKLIRISADASQKGLGAVLLQKHNTEWLPVAYASRALTDTESQYASIEQSRSDCSYEIRPFWNYRDELLVFKGSRVVIPKNLRKEMLQEIHAGHLGGGHGQVAHTHYTPEIKTTQSVVPKKKDSPLHLRNAVAVESIAGKFMLASNCSVPVKRRMFPLVLAYRLTAHKSQGSTYQFMVANFAKPKRFPTPQGLANTILNLMHVTLMSNSGPNSHDGILLINTNGIDHVVCADRWTNENSRVVCRTIGTTQGYVATHREVQDFGVPVLNAQIICSGQEVDLSICPRYRHTTCLNDHIIHVTCSPSDLMHVTLMSNSGPNSHDGILLINTNGIDHVVCADRWTNENSRVVCRTIGTTQGYVATHREVQDFGVPVLNAQIICSGQEVDLSICPRYRHTTCLNDHIIHVTCSPSASTPTTTKTTAQTTTLSPTTTSSTTTTKKSITTSSTTTVPSTTETTTTTTATTTPSTTTPTFSMTPTSTQPTTSTAIIDILLFIQIV